MHTISLTLCGESEIKSAIEGFKGKVKVQILSDERNKTERMRAGVMYLKCVCVLGCACVCVREREEEKIWNEGIN